MKNKLFVFDLDGTLLYRNQETNNLRIINPSAAKAIKRLIRDKYHVIFATGRHYSSTLSYIKEIGIKKYVITSNGGVITDVNNSKPIFITEKYIDKKIINIFVNLAKKYKVDFHWSTLNENYKVNFNTDFSSIKCPHFFGGENIEEVIKSYSNFENVQDTLNQNIIHIALKAQYFIREEVYQVVKEQVGMEKDISILKPQHCYIDCNPFGINKYCSILKVAKLLNINNNDDIYVFGDSDNDYKMLKKFKNSVTFENASENVKRVANYVIGSNETSAIHDFIMKEVYNE